MPVTNKAAFFKKNPGGANVVNLPVLPAANGTWANNTSATAATQDAAMTAAGSISFDYPVAGVQTEFKIPFFTA